MSGFHKFYWQILWLLSYVHVKNPFARSRVKVQFLSVSGVLNIVHCACVLSFAVEGIVARRTTASMSEYMLFTVEAYIDGAAAVIIRVTAASSSACFVHIMRYLRIWGGTSSRKVGKTCYVVVGMVLGSALHSMCTFITVTQRAQTIRASGFLGQNPWLARAAFFSLMLTYHTVVPFALSYVVIVSSELVDEYRCLCQSLHDCRLQVEVARELKARLKMFKRCMKSFVRASRVYCSCIVASSATAWLEMVAILTSPDRHMDLTLHYYPFYCVLSLLVLARAGNRFHLEVKMGHFSNQSVERVYKRIEFSPLKILFSGSFDQ